MAKVICVKCEKIVEAPSAEQKIINANCKCGGHYELYLTEAELEEQRTVYRGLSKEGKKVADKWRKMMERTTVKEV